MGGSNNQATGGSVDVATAPDMHNKTDNISVFAKLYARFIGSTSANLNVMPQPEAIDGYIREVLAKSQVKGEAGAGGEQHYVPKEIYNLAHNDQAQKTIAWLNNVNASLQHLAPNATAQFVELLTANTNNIDPNQVLLDLAVNHNNLSIDQVNNMIRTANLQANPHLANPQQHNVPTMSAPPVMSAPQPQAPNINEAAGIPAQTHQAEDRISNSYVDPNGVLWVAQGHQQQLPENAGVVPNTSAVPNNMVNTPHNVQNMTHNAPVAAGNPLYPMAAGGAPVQQSMTPEQYLQRTGQLQQAAAEVYHQNTAGGQVGNPVTNHGVHSRVNGSQRLVQGPHSSAVVSGAINPPPGVGRN